MWWTSLALCEYLLYSWKWSGCQQRPWIFSLIWLPNCLQEITCQYVLRLSENIICPTSAGDFLKLSSNFCKCDRQYMIHYCSNYSRLFLGGVHWKCALHSSYFKILNSFLMIVCVEDFYMTTKIIGHVEDSCWFKNTKLEVTKIISSSFIC